MKVKLFTISDDDLKKAADWVCNDVEDMMKESWEDIAESGGSLDFDNWLSNCHRNVIKILCEEWTKMNTDACGLHKAAALEGQDHALHVALGNMLEGVYAQIASPHFATVPRQKADTTARDAIKGAFTNLVQEYPLSGLELHDDDDDEQISVAKWAFDLLEPTLVEVVQGWKLDLKPIVKEINTVVRSGYNTLQQRQVLSEASQKELLKLCKAGATLVNKVIINPADKPPIKTLQQPLPKFCPSPIELPSTVKQPSREENRVLDVAYDLVDEPFMARMDTPHSDGDTLTVAMHVHPDVQAIVTSFKQKSQSSDMTLPPIIILGCPGRELVDSIGSSLEVERYMSGRELQPVASLRILLVDEHTYSKAQAFVDKKGESLLIFVVKTGPSHHLRADQLLDYCHLLGGWLAEDEDAGGVHVPGLKHFIRMESSVKSFKEASSGLQLSPASPARVFKGLQQAFLKETARQEQAKGAAIVASWDVTDIEELKNLYPHLAVDKAGLMELLLLRNKIVKTKDAAEKVTAAEQLQRLKQGVAAADFPQAVCNHVQEQLRVEVLSVSALSEGNARKRWLDERAATLAKNREQNLRCNYRVRFHKSRCSTYEQTQCVLVNSAVVRGIWACTNQAFVAKSALKTEEPFWKVLRTAEGRIASALKTKFKAKSPVHSTGLSCLVIDQFCVNSDFRGIGKGSRKRSPVKSREPSKKPAAPASTSAKRKTSAASTSAKKPKASKSKAKRADKSQGGARVAKKPKSTL
jgi:hypothetical protein